ncbi:MAG: tRNA (adenosine(37)-N6)-threonylcarbamoyltransferase complex ATPase subunit type 1 TsaE, partial [bacterium]|nr:tRNA (adenosine(37)-N6)-threonylcarbamoyltransferase complex ATPase subunit type 1 TsaE [bacterium]
MRTIIKKIVSVAGMARFAKDLAKKYVYQPVNNHSREWLSKRSGALVIALEGELGAGKTTLTKAFLKTLGVRENVTSPTFILFRPYVLKDKSSQLKAFSFTLAYHIDCYRLENP